MAAKKKPAGKAAGKSKAAKQAPRRKRQAGQKPAPARKARRTKVGIQPITAADIAAVDNMPLTTIKSTDDPDVLCCRVKGKPDKFWRWVGSRFVECDPVPMTSEPQHVVMQPVPAEEIERLSESVRASAAPDAGYPSTGAAILSAMVVVALVAAGLWAYLS